MSMGSPEKEISEQLEQYHAESFGWALACCSRNREEADAVLQRTYLKVLSGKARYHGKSSFRTWLFSVIRRTAIDERRTGFLRRLIVENLPPLVKSISQPDESLYTRELRDCIGVAMSGLPKRQKEVLFLVFYHELSLAEAAQVMGVSKGTAHRHYERAKNGMRDRLEALKIDESTGRSKDSGTVSAIEAG